MTILYRNDEAARNALRTVIVPVEIIGPPHSGGCLYRMSNGDSWVLTPQEVVAINLRSIEAGEGGGCLPAEHRSIFGFGAVYEPAPEPRHTSWWPGIFAAGITFGAIGGFFTAEWWLPALLRTLERM